MATIEGGPADPRSSGRRSDDRASRGLQAILALLVFALFTASSVLPYFVTIPEGTAGNLILSSFETVKNVTLIIVGWAFGSTVGSARRNDQLMDQLRQPPPPAPGTATFQVGAPASVDVQPGPAGGTRDPHDDIFAPKP